VLTCTCKVHQSRALLWGERVTGKNEAAPRGHGGPSGESENSRGAKAARHANEGLNDEVPGSQATLPKRANSVTGPSSGEAARLLSDQADPTPASQQSASCEAEEVAVVHDAHSPNPAQSRDLVIEEPSLKLVYDFTIDIIDKQYRSYTWSDGKVQALVTMDAALIAGLLLVFQVFKPDAFALTFLGVSFVLFILGFLFCLVHAIPRLNSKVGNEDNFRTIIGIESLSKEDYHEAVLHLSLSDMVRMNCAQISGMCRNNVRSQKMIRTAVWLTIAGTLVFAFAMLAVGYGYWSDYSKTKVQTQHSSAASQSGTSSSPGASVVPSGPPTSTAGASTSPTATARGAQTVRKH
jgi:Na+-transporting methylmalonyl-CoA/oxaloacetate decarboxylase gamma subunit